MKDYIIETYDLTKNFKTQKAVKKVNLKIKPGIIYGLLGKNGAGKTTLMCMLLNLVRPSSGKSYIFGYDTKEESKKIYHKVGSIIETPGFYTNLTGYENLKLFSNLAKNNTQKNINKVLKIVNLYEYKDRLFKNYSLGMKQRLGIAMALLKEPDVLILDEPINGLDPIGIIEIRELLKKLSNEFGITILISSHILSEIEQIADIIGIMHEGELIKEITIDELHQNINKFIIIEVSDMKKSAKILTEAGLTEKIDFTYNENKIKLLNHFNIIDKINEYFVKNQIGVFQIKIIEENLEEYFIKLIGEKYA